MQWICTGSSFNRAILCRTEAETLAFVQSEAFHKNPAGIDIDPAEYVRRYREGMSLEELRRIPEPA